MIHWITPTLGTGPYEDSRSVSDATVVDVRGLVDRIGNSPGPILQAVDDALAALARSERVLVCCDHGISRSNAIATGVLAKSRGMDFDQALQLVLSRAGHPEIRVEVLAAVREALYGASVRNHTGPRRVLVTGAGGALGAVLLARAPANIEVVAPRRDELDLSAGPADIESLLRRQGIHQVMHFAQPHATNLASSMGAALAMLRNLLDACASTATPLLLPSNWLVFAGHPGSELLADESTPPSPLGCLGDTKALSEALVTRYAERSGLATTILRSGPVLGAGIAPRFIHNLWDLASRGAPILTHRYDNGPPSLDFLSADDYATAAWGLAQAGATGIFHVGTGELTDTGAVARQLVAVLDSSSPLDLTPVLGRHCSVRLNAKKIGAALGWRASNTFEQALREFIALPHGRPHTDSRTKLA